MAFLSIRSSEKYPLEIKRIIIKRGSQFLKEIEVEKTVRNGDVLTLIDINEVLNLIPDVSAAREEIATQPSSLRNSDIRINTFFDMIIVLIFRDLTYDLKTQSSINVQGNSRDEFSIYVST